VEHDLLHRPDLVAFSNLRFHGFDPVLLFLRLNLALATLSAKVQDRHGGEHECRTRPWPS